MYKNETKIDFFKWDGYSGIMLLLCVIFEKSKENEESGGCLTSSIIMLQGISTQSLILLP